MSRSRSPWATSLALLVSTAAASPALAQASATPTPGSTKLVGEWVGPYTTDGPSGTMSLKVLQAAAAWKIDVDLGAEAPPPGAPSEVTADGNVLTWRQPFGEYDVLFKATLDETGAKLTGTIEANQGGSYVGGGSFTLSKKT